MPQNYQEPLSMATEFFLGYQQRIYYSQKPGQAEQEPKYKTQESSIKQRTEREGQFVLKAFETDLVLLAEVLSRARELTQGISMKEQV